MNFRAEEDDDDDEDIGSDLSDGEDDGGTIDTAAMVSHLESSSRQQRQEQTEGNSDTYECMDDCSCRVHINIKPLAAVALSSLVRWNRK